MHTAVPILLKLLLIGGVLGLWFYTQALIGKRKAPTGRIRDGAHGATARLHSWLVRHPRSADRLLILSSGLIDALGIFLLGIAVVGPTVRPLLGLIAIFLLRQICQGLCAMPSPKGMIWRNPGFPSALVTYGAANDLFFSGHTAIAVYGAIELARWGGPWFAAAGAFIALFETSAVLVLRAHYTMDVFAAIVTVFAVDRLSYLMAPALDGWLSGLAAAAGLG